jgi:hypothetical protein
VATGAVTAGLDAFTGLDLTACADEEIRSALLALITLQQRLAAQVTGLVGEFDQRGLAGADAQRSTKTWLQAFGRLSGHAAHAQVRAVRTLRTLPELAAAFAQGAVGMDHVNQIRTLHDKESDDVMQTVESILVGLARTSDPDDLRKACDHVREVAHAHDDADCPDTTFDRRQITLSRIGHLWQLTGSLDPQAGAALRAALEAYTPPPAEDDPRSAAQRRHDALADLVNEALHEGRPPTTGGHRPQIGVLVPFDLFVNLHPHQNHHDDQNHHHGQNHHGHEHHDGQENSSQDHDGQEQSSTEHGSPQHGRPEQGGQEHGSPEHDGAAPARDPSPSDPPPQPPPGQAQPSPQDQPPDAPSGDAPTIFRRPDPPANNGNGNGQRLAPGALGAFPDLSGLHDLNRTGRFPNPRQPHQDAGPEPAYLESWGPINRKLTERLLCDCAIFRLVLDPTTGQPLNLGRTHRTAPPWIRKALWARDRGCRWPGCKTDAHWTDAHHLRHWTAHHGPTNPDNLISLCRYHHVLVHEAQWTLEFDPTTGTVTITRPNGRPYELQPTQPFTSANTRTNHPPKPGTD